ncbi:dynamin family protein [Halobacillus karajensis]|uniref:GTPase Era n=1 Tax=Halobacillus karajensis TaxID=195088 RepID=A0A024P1X1_9BACI|nr:dynamin family protein [Halobacillus karajensis]CDQ19581.1 GTPase Era [Halobacillus karajensis]CDQ22043.1 GTPase Era [Halobacillus karajensis]CDQ27884.1 GTPase Era [Halobacillus karajensis]
MSYLTDVRMNKIQHLYIFLSEYNFTTQQEKLLDLYEKMLNKEMIIGFAGHFSAGKSTLINQLLENNLLPSSPIPTSANIVRLSSGDAQTIVYFQDGSAVRYDTDVDLETIKALCKNGDTITGLNITKPGGALPSRVSVVDTPGVDSTNDADRLITESSLHLMDYMYYVMDYNHVQSEVNLMFLLEMQRRETPFSIVINQVDKHVERELTFEEYENSVKDAFGRWGIEPENIYFTSMRDFSLPFNSFEDLREDFHALSDKMEDILANRNSKETEGIAEEAVREYSNTLEQEMEELRDRKDHLEEMIERSHLDSDWLENQKRLIGEATNAFRQKIRSFIPNAYLMPSSLREYAESYLKSLQPNFKVGILFTQKKTEEERRRREDTFYQKVCESIEQNLYWPLRERMLTLSEHYTITDQGLLDYIQNHPFIYPKEKLSALVEQGASVTGPYVLRYTDEVAKDIQKEVRSFVQKWEQLFIEALDQKQMEWKKTHKEVFEAAEEKQMIDERMTELTEHINKFRIRMEENMDKGHSKEDARVITEALKWRRESITDKDPDDFIQQDIPDDKNEEHIKETHMPKGSSIEEALQRADRTLKTISHVDGTQRLYKQLKNKQNRLENRHYTIALFGAFSAGKSSFANALLGDLVLPVSPNPTTATINKISPSNEQKPNRSIDAYVKKEIEMLEDLAPVLESISIHEQSLADVYHKTKHLKEEDWQKLDQKQHSFLRAFIEGYEEMASSLGSRIDVPWEEFSSYVSTEKKSCFIESMELFYDCPWTQAGITLVDTPGADSVNARHTNVSFEYIKDSDAVLFVTYYNHPFSHADQTFLTQLGRVKDSFALDKMFFLINAADLADSQGELKQVETYVKRQLNDFQIRHPKLYSVSSLKALEEKHTGKDLQSGIQSFERSFQSFLNEELAQMMVEAIDEDIRSIRQVLENFIETSRMDEDERQLEKAKVEGDQERLSLALQNNFAQGTEDAIKIKAEKQIHYVHERIMLNFNDLFKRHFNPASIQNTADVKEALKKAQEQLLEEMSFEMLQETKAVCVRMERFIENLEKQTKERIESEIQLIRHSLQLSHMDEKDFPLPPLNGKVDIEEKQKSQLIKLFRNPKAFFERNEKEEMKDTMSEIISPVLKDQLNSLTNVVIEHYTRLWHQRYKECKDIWAEDLHDQFAQLQAHLDRPIHTKELEDTISRLPSF